MNYSSNKLIYADKNLKSLEKVVNKELEHVSDWLIANKLTLNITKSNYVLFHSHKKKLDYILLISKSSIINLVIGFRLNQRLLLSTLVSYWTAIYLGKHT
jgi:hypothetical protein